MVTDWMRAELKKNEKKVQNYSQLFEVVTQDGQKKNKRFPIHSAAQKMEPRTWVHDSSDKNQQWWINIYIHNQPLKIEVNNNLQLK